MQKYYKHPDTKKIITLEVGGIKDLDKWRKLGFVEATPQERLAYITKVEQSDRENNDLEADQAKRDGLVNIYYMAPHKNDDGYGQSCRNIKDLIKEHGIYLDPIYRGQEVGLCYHLPNTLQLVKTPIKISFTMFETNQYPKFWEPYLKSADHVIVPTQFCADIMEANFGIRPDVCPLGYFPKAFSYIERQKRDVFTFLHYDAFKWRKGWDILFRAFNEEFGEQLTEGDPDVRLIFKTTLGITPPLHEYPKIKVIKGRIPQEDFTELMATSDCFVFPTRGEGFGLTPLEAMATGMRTIVPNHSGITHYWDKRYCIGLDYYPTRAKYDNLELRGLDLGDYWEPTTESLKKAMRKAYNEWKAGTFYDNCKEIAEYAKQFTIQDTAKNLSAILKRFV